MIRARLVRTPAFAVSYQDRISFTRLVMGRPNLLNYSQLRLRRYSRARQSGGDRVWRTCEVIAGSVPQHGIVEHQSSQIGTAEGVGNGAGQRDRQYLAGLVVDAGVVVGTGH